MILIWEGWQHVLRVCLFQSRMVRSQDLSVVNCFDRWITVFTMSITATVAVTVTATVAIAKIIATVLCFHCFHSHRLVLRDSSRLRRLSTLENSLPLLLRSVPRVVAAAARRRSSRHPHPSERPRPKALLRCHRAGPATPTASR